MTRDARVHVGTANSRSGGESVDPHPRIAGRRVTDASALVGACCWVVAAAASRLGALSLTLVEQFVALAVLVLVPLGLGLAASGTDRSTTATNRDASAAHDRPPWWRPYRVAVLAQLPSALAATAALALPVGSTASVALAVPWFGVTVAVATTGFLRLSSRGLWPVQELAIDAALLYVPVGAVALLLHRSGISLRFRPIIVLLTAIHYHYAGFVLPLVTGRVGRILAAERFGADRVGADATPSAGLGDGVVGRATAAATLVIVGNVALIAVGITFSPTVELIAVALFAVAVVAFAAATLLRVVPAVERRQGALLAVAFATLFWTMALALAYGYSAFPATGRIVSIGQMITLHGVVNALAFALPAVLGLRLRDAATPAPDGSPTTGQDDRGTVR